MTIQPLTNSASNNQHCVPPHIIWVNRLALFTVFFWFGFLKIVGKSPAESLIISLHNKTIASLMSINDFLIYLGVMECLIGLLWLFPYLTRFVIAVFLAQMCLTFLPLAIIPSETWESFLVLSLSGQYILKNVVLVACAFTIYKDCKTRGWKKCCF